MKAAELAFTLIGAVANAQWQSHVDAKLDEIQQQLQIIEQKLDQLIAMVSALPEIIRQAGYDLETTKLSKRIASNRVKVGIALSKYTKKPRRHLSAADRKFVTDLTLDSVGAAIELQDWGPQGFVALGDAYSQLLLATKLLGELPYPVAGVKANFLQNLSRNREVFADLSAAKIAEALPLREQAMRLNGLVYLGYTYISAGSPPRSVQHSRYGIYKGDIENGFKLQSEFVKPGLNPQGAPQVKNLGPRFAVKFGDNANERASGNAKDIANGLAQDCRPLEKQAVEALALSLGSAKVAAAIEQSVPILNKLPQPSDARLELLGHPIETR